MLTASYPAVVNVPHYQLVVWTHDSIDLPSGMLHPDRASAERELVRWRAAHRTSPIFDQLHPEIWTYQPVFLLRCGDCADTPAPTWPPTPSGGTCNKR